MRAELIVKINAYEYYNILWNIINPFRVVECSYLLLTV